MTNGEGDGKFSKENLTHFVPNGNNNTLNGRVEINLVNAEREQKLQEHTNESSFCRALLAGIHGVEPEQLTEEFLRNVNAKDDEKRRIEAEKFGRKIVRPGNSDKELEDVIRKLSNLKFSN
jgi:hypothetical protein